MHLNQQLYTGQVMQYLILCDKMYKSLLLNYLNSDFSKLVSGSC